MKQIVKNRWAKRYREYFMKWKKTAEMIDVAATCDEAGVVRLEKNKLD